MAGNTFVTRAGFQVSADTGYSSRITRAGLVGTFTTSFSTRLTRAGFGPSVWTAYLTRTTRAGFSVSVITCSSSSYIPPAATGLITLTATDTSGGSPQISLAWNAPVATGQFTYTLARGLTMGGETTTLLSGSPSLSYVDNAVAFDQQYYYIVTAINQCDSETASNEATASPGCTLPAVPIRLKATADNGAAVIRLIWNSAALATSYDIYRGTTAGAETLLASGISGLSYTDTSVQGGVQYFYTLRSENGCGMSLHSNEASAKLSCCTRYTQGPGCDTTYTMPGEPTTVYTIDEC